MSRRIRSRSLKLFSIIAIDIVVMLTVSSAIAIASINGNAEISPDRIGTAPWSILFTLAERNLAALLAGVLGTLYYLSTRYKILERLDASNENQKKMIRYMRAIGRKLEVEFPNSKIPDLDDE